MGAIKERLRGAWTSLRDRLAAWKVAILAVVITACVCAAFYGLHSYRQTLVSEAGFCIRSGSLHLVQAGSWMTPEIVAEVRTSLDTLPERLSVMDSGAAEQVARSLAANPWIRKVEYVRLDRPRGGQSNGLEVSMLFRRPVAFVQVGQGTATRYYMVDREGVRLGNRGYEDPQLGDRVLLVVTGVTSEPSTPGQPWGDPSVTAAADLADMLRNDVLRYNLARLQVREAAVGGDPEITLFTKHDRTQVVWGGPRCRKTAIREGKTAAQKLSYLEYLHKTFGGFDRCGQKLDLVEWYRQLDPQQPPPVRIAGHTRSTRH